MAKGKWIGLRVSESDIKKIETLKAGRSTTDFLRDLIKSALENEQQEVNNFIELLKKIENTDTAKLIEKTDEIINLIKAMNNKTVIRVFKETLKIQIMLEELANALIIRSDYREKYFERVKQRIEEKQL